MPVIFSLFAWFVWDVIYCVYTQAEIRPLTEGELILAGSGAVFAVVALILEHVDIRQKDRETAAARETHLKEMGEIKERLAAAAAKSDAKLDIVALLGVDRVRGLQDVTQTTGEPVAKSIEIATEKLSQLEKKVARYEERSWEPMSAEAREKLIAALRGFADKQPVQISSNENPDCVELGTELRTCFKDAGWNVRDSPLTGAYGVHGVTGLRFMARHDKHPGLAEWLSSTILPLLNVKRLRQVAGSDNTISLSEDVAVWIVVGPKRLAD
jgi:hypothetical protein